MKSNTRKMNILTIFIAIILIQTSVPGLGNLPIGPLSITIIPITVVLAAILLGTKDGSIIGGAWGIITFIRAFWWPTSPIAIYVFINPLVSIFPRIMTGLVSGLIFHYLYNKVDKKKWVLVITGMIGSLVNTVLLLSLIYLFYRGNAFNIYHLQIDQLLPYLLGVAGTNGVIEAILSGILVPVIATPLLKFKSKM